MAPLKDYLSKALRVIKNGNGRLITTQEEWFEVDYETLGDMISDAQTLHMQGYNTCMNRKIFTMVVSMGM